MTCSGAFVKLDFMYIRKVTQAVKKTGKKYYNYRLVESVRTERGVRQRFLINLGSNVSAPKEHWIQLANRIEEILSGQKTMFTLEPKLERIAQKYAKALALKQSTTIEQAESTLASASDSPPQAEVDYQRVDINSLANSDVSTIGGEHVAHQTILKLGLDQQLTSLGLNSVQVAAAMGTIVGRMLHPGSERATHKWLQEKSGLGELVGYDFNRLSLDKLYKISDVLLSKKDALENFLYEKEKSLFNLDEVITLYDLTNTYFEGSGKYNDKAAFGRSKEKRSDCRLVTLALVLNRDGFPKRSAILPGNISEPKTLKNILQKLHTDNKATKPLIIMDAGIATEENLKYLKEQGYTYIVVSRKRDPVMPEAGDEIIVKKQGENVVTAKLVNNLETGERELYCNSTAKAKKEEGIRDTFCQRFEEDLTKLAQGLHKKGCVKNYDKILVSLGRLKEKYKRVSGKYEVTVEKDDRDEKDAKNRVAVSITWDKKQEEKSPLGIYCLRTNNPDWDEQRLWKTYTMLTEIESAFRCMKSELGMRPVYHQKTNRIDGHLFITVLAYHIIHSIRYQLKQQGVDLSWTAIREGLSNQYRLTTMLATDEKQTIHVRQTSQPSQWQRKIYSLLGLAHHPGEKKVAIM